MDFGRIMEYKAFTIVPGSQVVFKKCSCGYNIIMIDPSLLVFFH